MLPKRPILCLNKEELGQIDEASEGCEESNVNEKSTNSGGNKDNSTMLGQLEPYALDSLHKLILLVRKKVKNIGQDQYRPTELNYESSETSNQAKHIASDGNAPDLVHESLAQILVSLEPFALQKILLAMVEHFPRTLEALILHMLEPATAEVLTCKFDEMEHHLTKEQQEEFYKKFYSVFDDPVVAMDAILNAK